MFAVLDVISVDNSLELQMNLSEVWSCIITEKAPTRAFAWLKAANRFLCESSSSILTSPRFVWSFATHSRDIWEAGTSPCACVPGARGASAWPRCRSCRAPRPRSGAAAPGRGSGDTPAAAAAGRWPWSPGRSPSANRLIGEVVQSRRRPGEGPYYGLLLVESAY